MTDWKIDIKVKERLEGSCFYPFTELRFFNHNTQVSSHHVIKTYYSDEGFQCGECNLYLGLQDIYYITGLPVDGKPIICPYWKFKTLVKDLLGIDEDMRGSRELFLSHGWLKEKFQTVPEEIDARDNRLDCYVRAYILFIIGTMLLPSQSQKGRVFIGYLHFLRDLNVVNDYAWGAAVLAKLHMYLRTNNYSYSGATWILEMFFLERVRRLKNVYLSKSCTLNNTFPSFREWSHLVANYAKNNYDTVPWKTILRSVRNNDDANGVVWTPYGRFVNEHKMERIFFSRILIFDFDVVIYHRPDHAPQQLGIQNPDSSNLLPLEDLKMKPRKGKGAKKLMTLYKSYIDMWNESRHQSCLKDSDPNFILPDAPLLHLKVQETQFQSENSHAAGDEMSHRQKSGWGNKGNPPPRYVPSGSYCEDEEQSADVDNTANHSTVVPETVETVSNHAKEFRKASSVIPLTPSMLMKSTEQGTDSSIAKCSLHYSGANPPLSKAKYISHNQQGPGHGNRMEESSKKRERELNAEVTSQKVPAAVDHEVQQQSAHVYHYHDSSRADDHSENQSPVKKSRKNLLEQSTSPKIEDTLLNYSNKLRTENLVNHLSPNECSATSMQVPSGAGDDKTIEDPAEVVTEGNVETFNHSSVNGQAESVLMGNEDLPFRKTSIMWKHIDSLEVFQILPQKPHFSPLLECNEETRQGEAISLMLTFASMVEMVSKLQIEDPRSLFNSYLEVLASLEVIGFDVKAVVDRINELLSLKTSQEQLDNQSKMYQSSVAEWDRKKAILEQKIAEIDKMVSELKEQRAMQVLEMVKEDSNREFIQLRVAYIKDAMLDLEHEFKVKSAAPWQRVI